MKKIVRHASVAVSMVLVFNFAAGAHAQGRGSSRSPNLLSGGGELLQVNRTLRLGVPTRGPTESIILGGSTQAAGRLSD